MLQPGEAPWSLYLSTTLEESTEDRELGQELGRVRRLRKFNCRIIMGSVDWILIFKVGTFLKGSILPWLV